MLPVESDFLERYGIEHVVVCGHPNADKDVAVPSYTFCEVVLDLSWDDPRVHFVASAKKGEAYNRNGFFHTALKKWIFFVGENQEIEKPEEEILPARSPRRARSVIASSSATPRSGVICRFDDDEDSQDSSPNIIDRSKVLIINIDTGKKFHPINESDLEAGIRVFYYDHHPGTIDITDLHVKQIVFICQKSLLETVQPAKIKQGLIGRFEIKSGPMIRLEFVDDEDPLPCFDNETLVLCINVGSEFRHFEKDAYLDGTNVFYYPEWSAAGLVFRTHEDSFKRSPHYEHYRLMTMITEANDYGKRFDAKNEYELGVFFQLARLLNGLNYNQVKPRDCARTLKAAFLAIESFLSNRIMFERNLEEVRRGNFYKLHGVRMFVHDFTSSGMTGETVRRFLQGPPYVEGKSPVDCIITACSDRMQVAVCNRELKTAELLDTSEIKSRILERFPELTDNIYKDDRGFLLGFTSSRASLQELEEIVAEFMDERSDKLFTFTNGVLIWREKILAKMREITSTLSNSKRCSLWKAFYQTVPEELQSLADRIFFGGISLTDDDDADGESTE